MKLTNRVINEFKEYLIDNDKSAYTVEKYIRGVVKFKEHVCDNEIEKETAGSIRIILSEAGTPYGVLILCCRR